MSRSYVAIYQNKKVNEFLYFDFNKNEFFSVAERKSQSTIFFTSFVSIVFYALMKNVSFGMTFSPLTMLAITGVLGIALGCVSIQLTNRAIEKGLEHRKEVVHPTNQELRQYLMEGKKQFHVLVFILLVLFFCVFLSAVFLYFMPQNVLMFLVNIGSWAISILVAWLIRPIQRSQTHKQLEGRLEKHSG
ncbi:hypothetical protein [Gracilibacillus timonensis]|uniref:hypothetical protein n=1 Tax=Gracilibacillus timonensis TaxID=1816696 RepID=UPI0008262EF2|nr:hypothetical protein [Gracilibacillus timonensis]